MSLLVLSGCVVVGNGDSVTDTRAIDGIDSVANASSLRTVVQVAEGEEEVEVTCDSNLIEYVETVVQGTKLTVRLEPNLSIHTSNFCEVVVRTTSLTELRNTGSGGLAASGALVDLASAKVTGSGPLQVTGVDASTLALENSGSGSLSASGTADALDVHCTGSGPVGARDLSAKDVVVHNSGSGGVEVTATESADVTLSGSGPVTVYGDPPDVVTDDTGSGEIRFR